MEELSLSNFQDVINVNVTGAFLCTREAIKIFKAQTPQGGKDHSISLACHQLSATIHLSLTKKGGYRINHNWSHIESHSPFSYLGRIINNGSISAHTPRPNSVAYTVSKHAITGLTKSTALDGRPFNISCTQIDIGKYINTTYISPTQPSPI